MESEKESIDNGVAKDIARAVKSIKFGYVQVTIQDSKVVQIDKTEKIRVTNGSGKKEKEV